MSTLKHGTESKHGGSGKMHGPHTADGGKPIVKPLPHCTPVGPIRPGKPTNHGNTGTQHKG